MYFGEAVKPLQTVSYDTYKDGLDDMVAAERIKDNHFYVARIIIGTPTIHAKEFAEDYPVQVRKQRNVLAVLGGLPLRSLRLQPVDLDGNKIEDSRTREPSLAAPGTLSQPCKHIALVGLYSVAYSTMQPVGYIHERYSDNEPSRDPSDEKLPIADDPSVFVGNNPL
jgi:hypothetical protein